MSSLFERLGGEAAVEAAVVGFYERIMADPKLSPFFTHLDMDAQIQKQISFMTMAFGGPSRYTGKDLRTAHAKLVTRGLSDDHFDATAAHLLATLEELGVEPAVRDEVMKVLDGMRKDVLGR